MSRRRRREPPSTRQSNAVNPEEVESQQATDLPDREAMTLLGTAPTMGIDSPLIGGLPDGGLTGGTGGEAATPTAPTSPLRDTVVAQTETTLEQAASGENAPNSATSDTAT